MWANVCIHEDVFGLTVSWPVYSVLIQKMVRRAAVMNLTGVQLLRAGNTPWIQTNTINHGLIINKCYKWSIGVKHYHSTVRAIDHLLIHCSMHLCHLHILMSHDWWPVLAISFQSICSLCLMPFINKPLNGDLICLFQIFGLRLDEVVCRVQTQE